MKILFTGSTSKQTDDLAWQRAKVKRIDDSTIICDSLRKQGYIVDRKEIKPGDDISEYDLTIVGLAPIGSPNSNRYIIGALYSIYNSKKVILFYEDWQIKEVVRKFKLMLTNNRFEDRVKNKWSNGTFRCSSKSFGGFSISAYWWSPKSGWLIGRRHQRNPGNARLLRRS